MNLHQDDDVRRDDDSSATPEQKAYEAATRNLSRETINALEADPQVRPDDSPLVRAAKNAYAALQACGHGVIDMRSYRPPTAA